MHIRFEEEEEGRKAAHQLAGPSCGPGAAAGFSGATGGVVAFHCVASLRTDFDQQDTCYVFDLIHNEQLNLVAARLSNKRIKLFSFNNASLQFVGELTGHSAPVTDARFDLPDAPHLLHSCSRNGSVLGWDARSGQVAESYQARAELLSCSTNGTLVAAGAGDRILFWDRRTQRPLASFEDTHMQEVTQVRFHPLQRSMLVSASEDGLIAVFGTAPQLDEDEGFKAALNIDTSPARLGFYGPQASKLWCTSGTETLHLWEWADACDDEAAGGSGPLAQALNAREQLTQTAAAAGPAGAALAPEVEYLVGCEYSAASDQLWVLAGTSSGSVGIFPVAEAAGAAGQPLFGPLQAVLAGGHSDVVRSVLWPGAAGGTCLTGGEDSKICTWSLQGAGTPAAAAAAGAAAQAAARPTGSTSSSDSVMRRQQQHVRRTTPY